MYTGIKSLPEGMRDIDVPDDLVFELLCTSTTVGWGDCDPAQIAYTAKIPAWALSAIEQWYSYCLDANWFDINIRRGIGTPFVSLTCDFHSPVTTDYRLEQRVFVSKIGNSSLSHWVEGRQNGERCFTVKTTAAFVDADKMKPIPIPSNMRINIEKYAATQGRTF